MAANELFQRKMELAGVSSCDNMAVAVSGGADSMALCLLALDWKRSSMDAHGNAGLCGFTVDHGLRPESGDEALQVQRWLRQIGMECEILKCTWPQGVPAGGHVQESARKARYALLQEACQRKGIHVLLTAHHADDQAELLVVRLSRCSGMNGLACMALATELYPEIPSADFAKLLLVRPLLELSKNDLYDVCRHAGQQWIEDPTNTKTVYARNRVRKELTTISDSTKGEVQNLIVMCRERRADRDALTNKILKEVANTDNDHGYVVLDADRLLVVAEDTTILENVLAAVLRFVAQRYNPPRGSSIRKTLAWLQNRSNEGRLTMAGCSLCLQPGSKGSKVIITYSAESPRPGSKSTRPQRPQASVDCVNPREKFEGDKLFLEAVNRKVISGSTANFLSSLSQRMGKDMDLKAPTYVDDDCMEASSSQEPDILRSGESTYFMQRYLISWSQQHPHDCKECLQGTCLMKCAKHTRVRYFQKADLSSVRTLALASNVKEMLEAWQTLKCLPEYVRRAIPVLETESRVLSAVPSVGFRICKDTHVLAKFCPRAPLGGGHAIWKMKKFDSELYLADARPRRSDASSCQFVGTTMFRTRSQCGCRLCNFPKLPSVNKNQLNWVPWFTHKYRKQQACTHDIVKSVDNVKLENTWYRLDDRAQTPRRRAKHGAVMVGRRMFVIGGVCSDGLLSDVQEFELVSNEWRHWKASNSDGPPCAGHKLFFWEKKLLVVGGHVEPASGCIEVYAFELETHRWLKVDVSGDIPMARIGQSIVHLGSMLIMFGGEDVRGQLRNDVHLLDLKTFTWLPSSTIGTRPCPRKGHSAACYASRYLWIFGGKSRISYLNDVHCLDLRAMEWVSTKAKGNVIPRAGHASAIVGHRWYIVGGEWNDREILGTLVFDLPTQTWTVVNTIPSSSPLANDGISMVSVHHRGRNYLMTYGGLDFRQYAGQVYLMMLPQHLQLQTGFQIKNPSRLSVLLYRLIGSDPPRRKIRHPEGHSCPSTPSTQALILSKNDDELPKIEEDESAKPRPSTASSQEIIEMLLRDKQKMEERLETALLKIDRLQQEFQALQVTKTTCVSKVSHGEADSGAEPEEKLIPEVVQI